MARGFGASETRGLSRTAQTAGFGAAEGGRNAEYDKQLEKIPLHKWNDARAFYEGRVEEVQGALDDFDSSLKSAEKALSNPNFDWVDVRRVAEIIPVPAPDALGGMDGADYMDARFEDEMRGDPDYESAAESDRNLTDDELRDGQGEVASMRAEWARGVVKEIVENAKLLRSGYVNGLSPKFILDEFRRTNNIRDRDGKLPD